MTVKDVNIVGIDPDTKSVTAVVLHPSGDFLPAIHRVEAVGRRAEDRIGDLLDLIREDFRLFIRGIPAPVYVYIESPIMGANAKALRDQAQIIGAVRLMLRQMGVKHSMVDNGTWKKNVIGHGHASKDDIKDWVLTHLQLDEGLAQDYYDAAAIAAYGLR